MVMVMMGGMIVVAAGAIAAVHCWRGDGYGSAATREDYDSRRPHPSDRVSASADTGTGPGGGGGTGGGGLSGR